jgi:large subunit ribosomal protein L13
MTPCRDVMMEIKSHGIICLIENIILFLHPFSVGDFCKTTTMDFLSYKTKSANFKTVNKEWWLIDAENQVLGRLASKAAILLRGKHKPDFTPHVDCGDQVIIINADKVKLTGSKMTFIVEHAVKGMLPKNRLGKELLRNLYVYSGSEHKHQAQNPKTIKLNDIK